MSYLAPIGFIYEDGTEVTEKNYQDGFNMTKKNGFLVMIDTESLDGFLTYDYRFMKSDGARYGYPRTQAFQKKEKVGKTSEYYYFDNSEKRGRLVDFPIIVIDRADVSKSYVVKNARGENYPRLKDFALLCFKQDIAGLTLHPRPDHRHATSQDAIQLAQ